MNLGAVAELLNEPCWKLYLLEGKEMRVIGSLVLLSLRDVPRRNGDYPMTYAG